jgi:hypothetical protein
MIISEQSRDRIRERAQFDWRSARFLTVAVLDAVGDTAGAGRVPAADPDSCETDESALF